MPRSKRSLAHLTREGSKRLSVQVRKHAPLAFLWISTLLYPIYLLSEAKGQANQSNQALYLLAHNSAANGCPMFEPSTTIVVSNPDPKLLRRELLRVATDLDNFEVAVGRAMGGKP